MSETTASAPGGDGSTSTPSAPAAAPASAALTTPAAPAGEKQWFEGYDTDTKGWLENRGMTKLDPMAALDNAIKGFRNAEKYMGVPQERLAKIPDWDKADKTELDSFFNKLGRPADAKGYDIKLPDGVPRDYADAAAAKFHEVGLTPQQARALVEWNNQYGQETSTKMVEASKAQVAEQEKNLRRDWGMAYDKNDALAGDAIRKISEKVGFGDGDLQKMTQAIGFDKAMKMFAEIGSSMGEDTYTDSGNGGASFQPKTPNAAQAKITQLRQDKEFSAKLLAGNAQAKAEWDKLHEMAYPS
jgi:hypothetical protein